MIADSVVPVHLTGKAPNRPVWLLIANNIGNRKRLLRPFGRQPLPRICQESYYIRASQAVLYVSDARP